MISRRVLIGTGIAVAGGAAFLGGAQVTHRLDDLADAVGLEPKPQPDADDERIIRETATDLAALLAGLEATAALHASLNLVPFIAIVREQLDAVGGSTATVDVAPAPAERAAAIKALVSACRKVSTARAQAAGQAISPDLARVLASMSAGLAQVARAAEEL